MASPDMKADRPPVETMLQLLAAPWIAQAITAAAELRVADQLQTEPRRAREVAAAVGASPSALYRVLRALATVGIVVEDAEERFALTALGECLRSDAPGSMRHLALFFGSSWSLAAWGQFTSSVRTGESAFKYVHGATLFEWLGQHPAESNVFSDALLGYSWWAGVAAIAAYDFSQFERIADIGGGRGHLLANILKAAPRAHGVLFDLPHVMAEEQTPLVEAGVMDRCERMAGDFFTGVPPRCDAYVMQNIIHDWDDARCARILSLCRAQLPAHGRVLVLEHVVPPPGVSSFAKLVDLEMLALTEGGRERTEREYAALFAEAGLRLVRVVATRSPVSVIEAEPR